MNIATETIHLVTAIPGPRSAELQRRREASVPRGVASVLPLFVRRASGATVEDIDGNQLLDFTGGIGCQNAGHVLPEAVAAIREQIDQFIHTCFMVTPYEGYVRLAEELNARTPGAFPKKTFFVTSGAEAVENAIKVARHFTRRQAVIAFEDGFHGRTQLALSLTGKSKPYKAGFGPFAPEVYRMPYGYCYRCPHNLTYPGCDIECARRLESTFKRYIEAESVAAVIFEPVLGEGGFVAPPPEWFQVITSICRKYGILVIADEIQTGFCRTGPMFACQHFDIQPDIIVTAKSIAAGLPLAAITGRAEIMDSPGPGGLGGTFGGNPVACAAALEILKAVDTLDLSERSLRIGHLFESITHDWPARFPLIGEIRGLGAMRAIELVKDRYTKEPASEETRAVLAACHRRGLIIISAGTFGNVIRMLVPLVATDGQIEEGMRVLEQALAEVQGKVGSHQ
ncbi:MAG: 4-aminobutyrate--2-oxoglutarate transaminase [Bryobacteraceae bacterium]|jgi:4-aminobutyrate aminotransferase/(S)-3-amino-2-methylpropionate transaminase